MSKHTAQALVWIAFWCCLFGYWGYVDGKEADIETERLKLDQKMADALTCAGGKK